MRILLVLNPKAGAAGNARVALPQLAALLDGHLMEVARPQSADAAEAVVRRAVADGCTRVLVGGGDGTVNSVLPALLGTDAALGILPVGTVNVLARELRIPLELEPALQTAIAGTPRQIDVAEANGKPFVLMAGLGFDARVVADVDPRDKEIFGPLAYITAGIGALANHKSSRFTIEMADLCVQVPAWLMIVANAGYYAYELTLTPETRIDDGLLDVCLFAEQSALDRLTQLAATAVGLHPRHPNITIFRTDALRVTADPPVAVQLDGDPAGASPVDIRVLPGALTVMTPG
jgi:diacylglycerol kinase (ATP)